MNFCLFYLVGVFNGIHRYRNPPLDRDVPFHGPTLPIDQITTDTSLANKS